MERKSMRPLTLKRVIEVCNIANINQKINEAILIEKLQITKNRSRELLYEIKRMKLLNQEKGGFIVNKNTIKILSYFENEDWQSFHNYFNKNYVYYNSFISILNDHINCQKGISKDKMIQYIKEKKIALNKTSIDVLLNWCERLGVIQRHLYKKRFYLLKIHSPKPTDFKRITEKLYNNLNLKRSINLRLTYVEIPKLREDVCEYFKIPRLKFDQFFTKLYLESIGMIELSGAPTITAAKKSPLSIKGLKPSRKDDILVTQLNLEKERRGIEIGEKFYYYTAIHGKLE